MILRKIDSIAVKTNLVEPEVNHSATQWLTENYDRLIRQVMSKGVVDKAGDLLADVYISLHTAECDGNGYDINYIAGQTISVEEFVVSRINKYTKSKKYRTDIVESSKYVMNTKDVVMEEKLGIDGKPLLDKNGKVSYEKKAVSRKLTVECVSYAAMPLDKDDDISAENSIAYKYNNAVSEYATRELESVDDALSIESSLGICNEIAEKYDINIMNMFRKIDEIADVLCGIKAKKEEAIDALKTIRAIADENHEFRNALEDVLMYSVMYNEDFKCILSRL